MSALRRSGDEALHYANNSHRWIAPPDIDQDAWDAGMKAHLDQHLATMGGPTPADEAVQAIPVRPHRRYSTSHGDGGR